MSRKKITYKEYQKIPKGESDHGFHAKPSYYNHPITKRQNTKPVFVKESKLISKIK